MKRITVLILSGLLIINTMVGCKKEDKEHEQNKTQIEEYQEQEQTKEENQEPDLELLEQEYAEILNLIDQVMITVSSSNEFTVMEGLELLDYVEKNRPEPTQELTIKLNNQLSDLIDVGIKYFMISNENKRLELENEIVTILDNIQKTMIEIETLLYSNNM